MYTREWNQMKFDAWKKEMDREIAKRIGLTSDDLPDQCYADWYTSGMTALAAAKKAIKNAKADMGI